MRLNRVLRFVLRDLASCKVRLSKTRIEPLITSQLQVEPVEQLAGVGHCGCRARARDGVQVWKKWCQKRSENATDCWLVISH